MNKMREWLDQARFEPSIPLYVRAARSCFSDRVQGGSPGRRVRQSVHRKPRLANRSTGGGLNQGRSMHIYRCFFLDEADHIKAAEIIEADAIKDVIAKVEAMLQARPQHRTIEIWEGGRRLYRGKRAEQN